MATKTVRSLAYWAKRKKKYCRQCNNGIVCACLRVCMSVYVYVESFAQLYIQITYKHVCKCVCVCVCLNAYTSFSAWLRVHVSSCQTRRLNSI